jgi:hypothetical protein
VTSFTFRPPYLRRKRPRYPLDRRQSEPEPVWTLWRRENLLLLPGIKSRFRSRPALSRLLCQIRYIFPLVSLILFYIEEEMLVHVYIPGNIVRNKVVRTEEDKYSSILFLTVSLHSFLLGCPLLPGTWGLKRIRH